MRPASLLRSVVLCAALAAAACASDDDLNKVSITPPPANTPVQAIVNPFLSDPRGQIFLPGYWAKEGDNWVWEDGKIVDRPYPTAAWAAPHWVKHKYGWTFVCGHWE